MIDARDEVVSSGTPDTRRRSGSLNGGRASARKTSPAKRTLRLERIFSDPKTKPFDQIEWDKRTAEITDDGGKVIFKQDSVEVPKSWSVLATKVVVSKYFYGEQDTPRSGEHTSELQSLAHLGC